jgi:hypothetical protein
LIYLLALGVDDGRERAGLDEHVPLAVRVHVPPSRQRERTSRHGGVPDEAGRSYRVVLLGLEGHPRSFGAGAMIWMIFSEIIPEAFEQASSNLVAVVTTLSVLAMVAFQVLIR